MTHVVRSQKRERHTGRGGKVTTEAEIAVMQLRKPRNVWSYQKLEEARKGPPQSL